MQDEKRRFEVGNKFSRVISRLPIESLSFLKREVLVKSSGSVWPFSLFQWRFKPILVSPQGRPFITAVKLQPLDEVSWKRYYKVSVKGETSHSGKNEDE